jgi:hypothetical protein
MESFITTVATELAKQSPALVVLLIIVFVFLKKLEATERSYAEAMEKRDETYATAMKVREDSYNSYLAKRDELYTATVKQISEQLTKLIESFEVHDAKTDKAVDEMHRTVATRKRQAK